MLVLPRYQALRNVQLEGSDRLTMPLPRVVVIGNFDGVHLGHQELFTQARSCLSAGEGVIIAMTFWPHPARLLAPPGVSPPPLICSRQRRRERLSACGVNVIIEQLFDRDFAALSAAAFVNEVLLDSLGANF